MFKMAVEGDKCISQYLDNLGKIKKEPDIEHSEETNNLACEDTGQWENRFDIKIEQSDELNDLVHENAVDLDTNKIKIEEIYIKTEPFSDKNSSLSEIIRVDDHNNQEEPTESCSSRQIEPVKGTITNKQPCFEMGTNETDNDDVNREDDEHKTNINNEERIIECHSTRTNTLVQHKLTHTGDPPYACDVCNKIFKHSNSLKQHKLIHTGVKPYVCDICNKRFTLSSHLTQHKLIHTGAKPHACDVCNKMFKHFSSLKQHKLIHTGDKPYVCEVCNKMFTQASTLAQHTRIHTGNKPYVCDVCNKMFTQSSSLAKHKFSHTGAKHYVCDICNKMFSHSSSLAQHRHVHSEDKSYVCDVCNKMFTRSSSLSRHKRIHTSE